MKKKISNVILTIMGIIIAIDFVLAIFYIQYGRPISAIEPALQIAIYLLLSYGIFLMRRGFYWVLFIFNTLMIQFPIFLWIFRDIKFYDKEPVILVITLPLIASLIILSLIFLGIKDET